VRPTVNRPAVTCLAALLLAAPVSASVRYSEQSDRTFEGKGLRVVAVENSRGDVDVVPSPDGLVHVTAIKTCRGRDRAEAEKNARDVTVTAGVQGDRCAISVHYPKHVDIQVNLWDVLSGKGDSDDWGPNHQVRLQLQVPAVLPLEVTCVSGDIATRGMGGRQSLHSTSGDIAAEPAGGVLEVKTVSGDAKVRGRGRATVRTTSGDVNAAFEGPLDARTTSGDIVVPSAGDSLVLGSTSGDITVEQSPRWLSAATSSGELDVTAARGAVTLASTSGGISVGLQAPLAAVSVTNSSGDVELELAPGLDASLELSTTSGDIESDVPVVLQGHSRQHLNAQYGRGGAVVKARTVSGDLHVTSGGVK
jgi:hypothetical protein